MDQRRASPEMLVLRRRAFVARYSRLITWWHARVNVVCWVANGAERDPRAHDLARLRAVLDEAGFEAAANVGQTMTLERAVALAHQELRAGI